MTPETPQQEYVFGYFPRNKYKDLVFYVKGYKVTGHLNYGLFEMPDTKENRDLMEALSNHQAPSPQPIPEFTPDISGKNEEVNTYRCCEICPNVPCKPLFRVNCLRQEKVEAHDTQIRNATLDAIDKFCFDTIPIDYDTEYAYPDRFEHGQRYAYNAVRNCIESLRSKEQP